MGKYLILFLFLAGSLLAQQNLWRGELDENGKAIVTVKSSPDEVFVFQANVFYKAKWRVVHPSWDDNAVYIDLGPEFARVPYRVVRLKNSENQ